MNDDVDGGPEPVEAPFEVLLPVGAADEPTHVAHMVGDKFSFDDRLAEVMRSDPSQAALLAAPIAMSISGPEVAEQWTALDSLGGATVRSIVPITNT